MQTEHDSQKEQTSATNQQVYAQLQQCGIDVYEAVNALCVAEVDWLDKVCDLLNIDKSACLFDAAQATFDNENKQLHLPKVFYGTQAELKRAVWRNIQQWV